MVLWIEYAIIYSTYLLNIRIGWGLAINKNSLVNTKQTITKELTLIILT